MTKESTIQAIVSYTRKRRLSKKDKKLSQKSRISEDSVNSDEKKSQDVDYLNSYIPVTLPQTPSDFVTTKNKDGKNVKDESDEGLGDEGGCKSLGKWFPNAIVIKCSVCYTNTGLLITHGNVTKIHQPENIAPTIIKQPKASLLLFYQYTTEVYPQLWSRDQLQLFITYLSAIAKERNLGGRMRVAPEGINATISAVDLDDSDSHSAATILRHFSLDLKNFDPTLFAHTHFKFIDNLSADRHFKECKILPVQELVFYGIREEDAPLAPNEPSASAKPRCSGVHLEPQEYHEMLQRDNTVVIDVRNHYETVLGRFDGQMKNDQCGAQYVDPLMRKSTDFTSWLAKDETKDLLQGKQVLMYCTGGIRCERASAYLKGQMGDSVQGVYQLKGGIENYMKAFPDGGLWRGKNFVFDKREVVSVENPDGDGGVIRKEKTIKHHDNLPSCCCICKIKWDRYVGKKKCFCCGVPVLMCDSCMSKKPDKSPDGKINVRCPLCVKENITVPAKDLAFTDNGVKTKHTSIGTSGPSEPRAASSVLKWGGGYSSKKTNQPNQRPCKFGSNCRRPDCFFSHTLM